MKFKNSKKKKRKKERKKRKEERKLELFYSQDESLINIIQKILISNINFSIFLSFKKPQFCYIYKLLQRNSIFLEVNIFGVVFTF